MPTEVDASLLVEEGAGTRQLNVADFKTAATGASTQATLAAVLAKIIAAPATEATLAAILASLPDESGTWSYLAGVSGTVNVPAGGRLLGVTATGGTSAASMTINGGATITIPANQAIDFSPRAQLVAPSFVFTSTVSYVVEYLT